MSEAAEIPNPSHPPFRFKERALLAFIIWVAAGVACSITYRTDAAPDYVIRQESLTAGLFAPLFLSGGVSANFADESARVAAFFGTLTLFMIVTGILLTRRSPLAVFVTAGVLASVLVASIYLLLRSYTIGVG